MRALFVTLGLAAAMVLKSLMPPPLVALLLLLLVIEPKNTVIPPLFAHGVVALYASTDLLFLTVFRDMGGLGRNLKNRVLKTSHSPIS